MARPESNSTPENSKNYASPVCKQNKGQKTTDMNTIGIQAENQASTYTLT